MGEMSLKVQKSRLKWYVLRREEQYTGNTVVVMEVPGPKQMWLDNIINDLS